MLVLSRKQNEKIVIDGQIEIEVISIGEGKVKLGITAPKDIEVHRGEVYEEIVKSNMDSISKDVDIKDLKKLLKR